MRDERETTVCLAASASSEGEPVLPRSHVVVVCGLKMQLQLRFQVVMMHPWPHPDHNQSSTYVHLHLYFWSSSLWLRPDHPKCILMPGVKGVRGRRSSQCCISHGLFTCKIPTFTLFGISVISTPASSLCRRRGWIFWHKNQFVTAFYQPRREVSMKRLPEDICSML